MWGLLLFGPFLEIDYLSSQDRNLVMLCLLTPLVHQRLYVCFPLKYGNVTLIGDLNFGLN